MAQMFATISTTTRGAAHGDRPSLIGCALCTASLLFAVALAAPALEAQTSPARDADSPQDDSTLRFEMPTITREMVVVIQGLIILFSGALVNMPRPWLQWLLSRLPSRAA